MKVKVRVKVKDAFPDSGLVMHVLQAGERGVTARELAAKLGRESVYLSGRLGRLVLSGKLTSEYVPCADWKTHYAVQESRFRVKTANKETT